MTNHFKLEYRNIKSRNKREFSVWNKENNQHYYFKKGGGRDLPVDQTMYVLTEPNGVNL